MKSPALLLLVTVLSPALVLAQSTDKDKGADNGASAVTTAGETKAAPGLNEETRLLQVFAAKRAAMEEARAVVQAKTKNAKTVKEKKDANDEVKKIQSDFFKDNADLIGKLKAIDAQKRPQKRG